VLPCTNTAPHDPEDCPYAHPAEKATRRDPRAFLYTGVSCPLYRKGSCKDGDDCRFAHGVFEVWLHPSRFRTELCKDGPGCTRKVGRAAAGAVRSVWGVASTSGRQHPPPPPRMD
jgi:hypothetical protein